MRNNLWDWQSLSPDSGGGTFFEFCDALEVKDGVNAGPNGWGLDHALTAWSSFWTGGYYADRECTRFPPWIEADRPRCLSDSVRR